MKTAQQAAANWAASAGRAQTAYQQGVEGYNGDWAGATTSQQTAMLQGVQQAVTSGLWAARINAVGTNGWKQATVSKLANYGTGFTAGASKQAAAIQKIISAEQNIVPSLPPRGDFNANLNRMTSFAQQMHALKGTLGAV
jgi:hypothetical protein